MALDLADIALVLFPDDGPALDVIRRQINECGSEHVAFLERKQSKSHVLYEQPPWDPTIFTAPVLFLRYSLWQYVFGRSMDSGDSSIILPFDFVSAEQFENFLEESKVSIRSCKGTTLLDGKAFTEGATADLKDGAKIEVGNVMFKVMAIRASAETQTSSAPKKDVEGEQPLSKVKGESVVNIRTFSIPHKNAMFNALPNENIRQNTDSVVIYNPVKPMKLMPRMGSDSFVRTGSNTVLEGLPKFEDYKRGDFVGSGSNGQIFKHKPGHSVEVFAVKVIPFPETTQPGREDVNKQMVDLFHKKMAYINCEVNILLGASHRFVLRGHQVFRYPEGVAIVMPYFEDGDLGSLAEYAPLRKRWPLPLSDARSISGQILDGIEYLHEMGYMHRDLKPANVLLRHLDPLEVVICDPGFAQETSKAKTRGGSGLWSAPECLWSNSESVYGVSVDVYSMGVILLWLLGVYADDGEYKTESEYDELFGHRIRNAVNASNDLEETSALTIGQKMAAYTPTERPDIQGCWESQFFGSWEPPPVKGASDGTTAFEGNEVGLKVDKGEDPSGSGSTQSIHKAKTHHTSGQVKVRTDSVLARHSNRRASLEVQHPAGVSKNRSKVPISNNLLDALSRSSLMEDT